MVDLQTRQVLRLHEGQIVFGVSYKFGSDADLQESLYPLLGDPPLSCKGVPGCSKWN